MKTVNQVQHNKCTGCAACNAVCGGNAINMISDQEGFWHPDINIELCTKCGQCYAVCPIIPKSEEYKKNETKKVYAAWSYDQEIRSNSTSGGIFTEIALQILIQGGYICGAVYDGNYSVKHILTNQIQDLKRIRQSKYVQSNIENVYQDIEEKLRLGKKVLFCGAPCQCEAVFQYLVNRKSDVGNLFLVDFICRGSNSPKVYDRFLKELEKRYHSKIKKVWFKNKTYGWNNFCTKIEFENGEQYLEDRFHDCFIRGYIEENLYIRPSCSECQFKGSIRRADITLADFWGIQLDDNRNTDLGTSAVMIHTKQGEEMIHRIKDNIFCIEKSIEDVVRNNECLNQSVPMGRHRAEFMAVLDSINVIDNIKRFLNN